ncbi:IclR family transcriptional regulator C-terminal domain-containing protein [Streptomyces sp. NPDC008150]|uniref:IclR family transcriptional regulator n=1 Tax=Streptomyces sp. NPDC008150 TaxID=3364816 RepID=UPI0036EB6A78
MVRRAAESVPEPDAAEEEATGAVDDSPGASAEGGRPGYYIAAIGRALAVLDAFSPERPELALRDVAAAADVTQPSALRIGYTLVREGFLVRNPLTKGYRLGPKAISVGMATLGSMTLPEIAEPYLVDLRDRTGETVKLAIHHGATVVFVSRVPSLQHPSSAHHIGTRLPIHATSLGRAILARLPEDDAERLVAESAEAQLTARAPSREAVLAELPRIRERGYAVNDQGTSLEHRSVAAPLVGPDGAVVGAVNLSVSAHRMSAKEMEATLAPEVVADAEAISAVLPPDVQGRGWS